MGRQGGPRGLPELPLLLQLLHPGLPCLPLCLPRGSLRGSSPPSRPSSNQLRLFSRPSDHSRPSSLSSLSSSNPSSSSSLSRCSSQGLLRLSSKQHLFSSRPSNHRLLLLPSSPQQPARPPSSPATRST